MNDKLPIKSIDGETNKNKTKGKFGIFYEFSKKHLLNKGVTEKSINDLVQLLKDQEKDGYKYKILNNGAWIEKFITNDNLSENSVIEITEALAKLIRTTKNKADIILQNGE